MIFIGFDPIAGLSADELVLDERGLLVAADEADACCAGDGMDAQGAAVRSW